MTDKIKASMITPRKLKGFRDYAPEAMRSRQQLIATLWHKAKLHGFEAIDTPILEFAEILMGSGGTETDKEVYRFEDNGGRNVALRFDLTVPFARYVAENQGTLVQPFKRLQIGEVFRGEKPQKGRYRQFCQGDFDIIGPDSLMSDVEILLFQKACLDEMVPAPMTIYLSHRQILSAIIRQLVPGLAASAEPTMLIWIDKWDKIPKEKLVEGLAGVDGCSAAEAEQLVSTLATLKNPTQPVAEIMAGLGVAEEALAEARRFDRTLELLNAVAGEGHAKFQADLSIARGLGYYTGIVMETKIDSLPAFGSIASGGRYNGLVSRFSKRELPGVGASIGVDRTLAALEELDKLATEAPATVYIALFGDEELGFGLALTTALRSEGIATDIALKPGKIANQFKYADKKGIPLVIAIGSDERDKGEVTIKRLADGHEQKGVATTDAAALAATIKGLLDTP